MRRALKALVPILALTGLPAAAQFSDSYNFLKAVRDRDGPAAKALLDKPGTTVVNARDFSTGETGLHIATRRKDVPWMAFLLQHGANPDVRDRAGETPLTLAAGTGFTEGVRILLAGRAGIDVPNGRGQTPLFLAVQARDVPTVRLLLDQGANPDIAETQTGLSARDLAANDPRAGPIARLLAEAPRREAKGAPGPRL
ncbi:MAG: ankyrin repeat domain-containing protein [Thermaurantiacus sp.]|uniref:ankyrin repeat domain-containing protein n=1 Tax=Thermaurantiacus sp. TaxID=2820283 RepID=UPI00298EDEC8|nr:ankyrin repeat domain-containing protein [Thermaurantiacus sp.]MDW8415289.1 ankyrin repeat domain-containing protein [Thermaurantiacus sp.]